MDTEKKIAAIFSVHVGRLSGRLEDIRAEEKDLQEERDRLVDLLSELETIIREVSVALGDRDDQ